MDKFSEYESKWGFQFDIEKLKEDCKMLQGHLTVKNISDINGKELFNELLMSV
jgi:hypothetical protein